MDAGGVDFGIGLEDVGLGAVGDGDDGVGVEDGGALHPGAEGITGAKLLGLPGAQRFERVRGENEGNVVELFGEEARHRDVPGVRVDDVQLVEVEVLEQVEREGFERAFELGVGAVGDERPGLFEVDVEMEGGGIAVFGQRLKPVVVGGIAPGVDLDFDGAGELAGKVFNVDACAAVDVRWILAGHQAYTHEKLLLTA